MGKLNLKGKRIKDNFKIKDIRGTTVVDADFSIYSNEERIRQAEYLMEKYPREFGFSWSAFIESEN